MGKSGKPVANENALFHRGGEMENGGGSENELLRVREGERREVQYRRKCQKCSEGQYQKLAL